MVDWCEGLCFRYSALRHRQHRPSGLPRDTMTLIFKAEAAQGQVEDAESLVTAHRSPASVLRVLGAPESSGIGLS